VFQPSTSRLRGWQKGGGAREKRQTPVSGGIPRRRRRREEESHSLEQELVRVKERRSAVFGIGGGWEGEGERGRELVTGREIEREGSRILGASTACDCEGTAETSGNALEDAASAASAAAGQTRTAEVEGLDTEGYTSLALLAPPAGAVVVFAAAVAVARGGGGGSRAEGDAVTGSLAAAATAATALLSPHNGPDAEDAESGVGGRSDSTEARNCRDIVASSQGRTSVKALLRRYYQGAARVLLRRY
jgi:hypothetical protein